MEQKREGRNKDKAKVRMNQAPLNETGVDKTDLDSEKDTTEEKLTESSDVGLQRLEKQVNTLENIIQQSNLRDIAYHFTSKREIIKVNLLAGLMRGIGFTIGTALFIGILFTVLNQIINWPIIGEFIAEMLDMIEEYRVF